MIGSPASETMLRSRGLRSKCTFCDCARIEMHALERAQGADGRARHIGEAKIKLRHFVAGKLARVGHGDFGGHGLAGSYSGGG